MKTIIRTVLAISVLALAPSASAQDADRDRSPVEGAAARAAPGAEGESGSESPAGERDGEATRASESLAARSAGTEAPAAASAEARARVVEGAPLGNANVHVHIVERKPYTNAGRHELVIYPAVAQINAKFTTHVGAAASYAYHLFENLSLQVTPVFHYVNEESGFNRELIAKVSQQAQAATAMLLQYGAVAGIEVTPMYGKFAFYEGVLGHFTFVLNAGAGLASTRIQLQPEQETNCGGVGQAACEEALFGDTGLKFLGSVGAGFRLFVGERSAIRLEVRDLLYTARVDKINGCTFEELENGAGSASCDPGRFAGDGRTAAKALLEETSSDVLNNVFFYAGLSFLF